jgi:hypothetical protein
VLDRGSVRSAIVTAEIPVARARPGVRAA